MLITSILILPHTKLVNYDVFMQAICLCSYLSIFCILLSVGLYIRPYEYSIYLMYDGVKHLLHRHMQPFLVFIFPLNSVLSVRSHLFIFSLHFSIYTFGKRNLYMVR